MALGRLVGYIVAGACVAGFALTNVDLHSKGPPTDSGSQHGTPQNFGGTGEGVDVRVRLRLLDLLVTHSYRYDAREPFQLSSGKSSTFYIDCKATTMRGGAMEMVGRLVAEHLPAEVEAVGGLTMGADPIATTVASYCTRQGRPLNAFSVRKEAKKHGLGKWIEGGVPASSKVAVLDDVVTTGGSTIDAIRRCREEGLEIRAIIVLVDRQEDGGLDEVRREAGPAVPVTALFTRDELQAHWARANQPSERSRSAAR